MLNEDIKNKKGFTLYEMIISVFIVSISSVFILQLFLFSRTLNAKANDIDNGSIVLLDAMEISKSSPSINKYVKDDFFNGSVRESTEDNEIINIYKCYDKNWSSVLLKTKTFDPENLPETAQYLLNVEITKVERTSKEQAVLTFLQGVDFATTYGDSTGLKVKIKGSIHKLDELDKTLVELETISYFGNNIR